MEADPGVWIERDGVAPREGTGLGLDLAEDSSQLLHRPRDLFAVDNSRRG